MKDSSQFLVGNWIGADIKFEKKIKLTIQKNSNFVIANISSKVVCDAKDDELISGSGEWEYDKSGNKLILKFNKFSTQSCPVPYGANAFVDSGITAKRIVFYPDGPDAPRSLVALIKQEN